MRIRTGVGVDVHQLAKGREMWLAGLFFPDEESGLLGHSDGDVACHAICDALLSAAGLGDLGEVFGVDDPKWANAPGATLLSEVVELVHRHGWCIANVAVQILGNRPKMAPHRNQAQTTLSDLIGAPVSVSASSTDHLGFTGRGEGLMAIATCLLFISD